MNNKEIALELTKIALSHGIVKTYTEIGEDRSRDKDPLEFATQIASVYNTILSKIEAEKCGDN